MQVTSGTETRIEWRSNPNLPSTNGRRLELKSLPAVEVDDAGLTVGVELPDLVHRIQQLHTVPRATRSVMRIVVMN
jgi:hypothetical protein